MANRKLAGWSLALEKLGFKPFQVFNGFHKGLSDHFWVHENWPEWLVYERVDRLGDDPYRTGDWRAELTTIDDDVLFAKEGRGYEELLMFLLSEIL